MILFLMLAKLYHNQDFLDEILDVYNTATNDYLTKYNALIKNRTIEKMVEL